MLEEVAGARRAAALVEQLRLDELGQPGLQCLVVLRRDRLKQVVGKLAPDHRPELGHLFGRIELVQPGHERIL